MYCAPLEQDSAHRRVAQGTENNTGTFGTKTLDLQEKPSVAGGADRVQSSREGGVSTELIDDADLRNHVQRAPIGEKPTTSCDARLAM